MRWFCSNKRKDEDNGNSVQVYSFQCTVTKETKEGNNHIRNENTKQNGKKILLKTFLNYFVHSKWAQKWIGYFIWLQDKGSLVALVDKCNFICSKIDSSGFRNCAWEILSNPCNFKYLTPFVVIFTLFWLFYSYTKHPEPIKNSKEFNHHAWKLYIY